jgi:phytoene synthase
MARPAALTEQAGQTPDIERRGSSSYYSTVFAPPESRPGLRALLALEHTLRRIPDDCRDPAVATAKLNWWRDELYITHRGCPNHPLTVCLTTAVDPTRLPLNLFSDLLAEVDARNRGDRFSTFSELLGHAERTGGALGELLIRAASEPEAPAIALARQLGLYTRLAQGIRYLGAGVRQGWLPIGESEIRAAGLQPDALHSAPPEQLFTLLHLQHQRTDEIYHRAFPQAMALGDRALMPILTMAILSRKVLEELARDRYPVLDRQVSLTPLRKLWIAWRTHRTLGR